MMRNDDILRSGPGLTRLGLAVAILGLVVIGGWEWVAAGVLSKAVIVLGTVVLAATYAGLLVVLAVAAVQRANRAREFAIVETRKQAESGKRLAIYDQATGLFHRWYFELRLREEIKRCQRYGLPMAVVAVNVQRPIDEPQLGTWDELNSNLALLVARAVRTVDIPASLGELEYVVCLTQCDRAGAETLADRLIDALGDYSTAVGVAFFPEDGSDAIALLEQARQRAQSAPQAHAA